MHLHGGPPIASTHGSQAHDRVAAATRQWNADLAARVDVPAPSSSRIGRPRYFRIPAIGRPLPHPVVAPVFRRPERMRIEWPVEAVPDRHAVQLTDRRGQALDPGAAMAVSIDANRGVLVVDLHIAALAEGDYTLELFATLGGEEERQAVAFRVGR